MPSSELSNALNPYIAQSRSRTSNPGYSASFAPTVQQPQQYVPHRSELELAVSEPLPPLPPPPPPPLVPAVRPRLPNSASVQAVQELLRIVVATRDSQELEKKRRVAWEQEQEAKYALRQAEMERQMLELRQEISTLRTITSTNRPPSSGLFTPQSNMSPAIAVQGASHPASPISPISQSITYAQPMFVQGSSNQPLHPHSRSMHELAHEFHVRPFETPTAMGDPPHSVTPAPSPQFPSAQSHRDEPSKSPVIHRKRLSSQLSSEDEDRGDRSDSSESNNGRPKKRLNHHDKRCLTIHHALREHIIRLMGLEDDKDLPDSHKEGTPLSPNEPVRFVWDKTAKQSVHNSRMKARVLADIKAKRRAYRHVPDKDFGKKALDAAFDQSFSTFRQKFKAQRDGAVAEMYKKREEIKAQKARHASRRKIKLSNRAEARMKASEFEHVTFDGAFQLECMSSEESDVETDADFSQRPVLRTRGYVWRSTRLMRFYSVLDDEEKADKFTKPKRGVGRKERHIGEVKDGFYLPPQGVATWMISRRWVRRSQSKYPDLPDVLDRLVEDPPGFDWSQFEMLGDETDDSSDELQTFHAIQHGSYVPTHHSSTSSLNYALM